MSKYTTEVRYICEHYAGYDESQDYPVNEVIAKSREKVFDFSYPIYDNNYRPVLETKILKHYYTREIGEETVALWKLRLDTRLNEIMPYYNQLYLSTELNFDPLTNVDLIKDRDVTNQGENESNTVGNVSTDSDEAHTGTIADAHTGTIGDAHTGTIGDVEHTENESETTQNKNNDHWEMFSDTPQGGLNGVRTETYLTTVLHTTDGDTGTTGATSQEIDRTNTRTFNENNNRTFNDTNTRTFNEDVEKNIDTDSTSNTTGNFTTTEDYLEHIKGLNGNVSYSRLLKEFRDTFINIDMMIIEELSDLFINLW